jgi:hypothetical protein
MYTQPNGPRAVLSTGRNRNTVKNIASKQDFAAKTGLVKGGRSLDLSQAVDKMRAGRRPPTSPRSHLKTSDERKSTLDTANTTNAFTNVTAQATGLLGLVAALRSQRDGGGNSGGGNNTPDVNTNGAGVKAQLIRGFIAAGKPELAEMVRTKAFDTWINAESGWNPSIVSEANNQGLANGGLFQIWYGHDFSNKFENPGRFTATPFQQAKMVAKFFDLKPGEIRQYARQIRAGTYPGWG